MANLENEGFEVHEGSLRSERRHGVHTDGEMGEREKKDTQAADAWLIPHEAERARRLREFKNAQEATKEDFDNNPGLVARSVASGADKINLDKYFPVKDQGIDPEPIKHQASESEQKS